jgi:hypothetical protein
MGEYFGDEERDHRRPKRLAGDPAVKTIEKIGPIHREAVTSIFGAAQSRAQSR